MASITASSIAVRANKVATKEFQGMKSASAFGQTMSADAAFVANTARTVSVSAGNKQVTEAKLRVAINGFGRIGRNFLRCWHGRENSELEVVCINDSGGVKQASHLLKYDSMLGTFAADVKVVDDSTISVDGKPIAIVSSRTTL